MEVGIFTSIDTLDVAEWDAVTADAPVFYHSRYLQAYERFPLTAVKSFRYLVVREKGRAVAVLPVSLIDGLDPLGQLRARYPLSGRELGLLSHVWHCYDAWFPGGSHLAAVVAAVVAAMRELAREEGAAWYGFVNVPHGSALREQLVGLGFPAEHIEDRFRLDLRADPPFTSATRSGRANVSRNRRRAAEFGVRERVVPVADADLTEIAALCAATSARHGTGGFYPLGYFAAFIAALGDLAEVIEVRQGDRLIGAGVCLRDRTRMHAWACGVDYQVEGNFSPYPVLFAASVERAVREGRTVFEGGRSNHVFKLRHGLTAVGLDACLLEA